MSQAFVKEPDGDAVADDQPELPISPHPNYVTPGGLAALKAAIAGLQEQQDGMDDEALADKLHLSQIMREIRYYEARIKQAIRVDPNRQPRGEVAFGAEVTVENEDGETRTYRIVGEDEADPDAGKVSWVSPLAKALLDSRTGDLVLWQRPAGEVELEIKAISYPAT